MGRVIGRTLIKVLATDDVNALLKGADSLYAGTIKGLFKLDETSGIWTGYIGRH